MTRYSVTYDAAKAVEQAVRNGTWWDFTQNTTITDASVPSNIATWSAGNMSISGTGPWNLVEDSASAGRYITTTITNLAGGVVSATIDAKKPIGGRDWIWVQIGVVGGCYFNLATGVKGTAAAGFTTSMSDLGNGVYRCYMYSASWSSTSAMYIGTATADSGYSYLGDGRVAAEIHAVTLNQRRASQLAPRIGTMATAIQNTAANQPFLWDGTQWSQASGLYFNASQYMSSTESVALDQPYYQAIVFNVANTTTFGYMTGTTIGMAVRADATVQFTTGAFVNQLASYRTGKNIMLGCWNASSSYGRINGVQGNLASLNSTARGTSRFGTYDVPPNTMYAFTGWISDIITMKGSPSNEQMIKLERALATYRSVTVA